MKDKGSFEVSGMVWLDDETDDWTFSLFTIHSDCDEDLLEWGAFDTREGAVAALRDAIDNYFSGV